MSEFALMKLSTMKDELDWVKRKVDALRAEVSKRMEDAAHYQRLLGYQLAFKEVLCHNDLLAGNILLTEHSTDGTSNNDVCPIHLIDYEYAAYNYLSYDLANHFIGIQTFKH
jgi:thiamine kinase-like enzyme